MNLTIIHFFQIKARKKVAITVLIFVLAFAVCFLPFHMYLLFFYFYPNFNEVYNAFWNYFRIVSFCLFYLHSCSNPVALYWVSGAFRKHFNRWVFSIFDKYTGILGISNNIIQDRMIIHSITHTGNLKIVIVLFTGIRKYCRVNFLLFFWFSRNFEGK